MTRQPHDVHPDLAPERLAALAKMFAEVRDEAQSDRVPERGDDNWAFGCMVYARTRLRLAALASNCDPLLNSIFPVGYEFPQESFDWLRVLDPSLKFRFAVGQVPFRFYSGDFSKPKPNVLRRDALEREASQTAFPFCTEDAETIWHFVIDVGDEGETLGIYLVQREAAGQARECWQLPHDGGAAQPMAPAEPSEKEPAAIEKKRPSLRKPVDKTGEDDNE